MSTSVTHGEGAEGGAKISAVSSKPRVSLSSAPAYQSLFKVGENGANDHGLGVNRTSPDEVLMEFVLSPAQRLELFVPPSHTVTLIKDEIAAQAQLKYAIALDPQRGFDLKLPGAPFITDGNMKLASLPYVVSCQHRGRTPTFLVLDKRSDMAREYKNENVTIGAIIGHSLGWTLKDEEITEFRQSTAKQRYDNYVSAQRGLLPTGPYDAPSLNSSNGAQGRSDSRSRIQSTLPTMLTSGSSKKSSRSLLANAANGNTTTSSNDTTAPKPAGPSKILIKIRFANGTFSTVAVNLTTDSADAVIARCYNSLLRSKPEEAKGKRADDFVLKPIGLATYIHGPMLFSQFKPIADAVLQRKEMQVDLIDRATAEEQNSDENSATLYRPSMTLEERLWEYTEVTATYIHTKISFDHVKDPHVFSVWDMRNSFRLRVLGVDNLYVPALSEINLKVALYEGANPIGKTRGLISGKNDPNSTWVPVPPPSSPNAATVIFPQSKGHIDFSIDSSVPLLCDLPRATQICFTLSYRTSSSDLEGTPIAWCNIPVFGYNHELVTGQHRSSMWRSSRDQFERIGHVNPRGSARPNYMSTQEGLPNLYLQFDSYALPVVFPTSLGEIEEKSSQIGSPRGNSTQSGSPRENSSPLGKTKSSRKGSLRNSGDKSKKTAQTPPNSSKPVIPRFPAANSMTNNESRRISQIISGYPIDVLSPTDKHLLWKTRELLKVGEPRAVSKFLQSIPLTRHARLEAYRVMYLWNVDELDAATFLELLDAKFADPIIRAWAVEKLEVLEDDDISDYLLQLIQALRYEPYLDCALTRFLLRRAVASPNLLGHYFFWYLKSELHNVETFERNGLLLEAFLRALTPNQRIQLGLQNQLVNALLDISQKVVKSSDKDNKVALLHAELHALNQSLFNNWTLSPPNVSALVNSQTDTLSSASHARQSVSFANFSGNRRTISRQNSMQTDHSPETAGGGASLPTPSAMSRNGTHSPLQSTSGLASPMEGSSPQDISDLASPPASPRGGGGSTRSSPPSGSSPTDPLAGSPNGSQLPGETSSPNTGTGHSRVSSNPGLNRTLSSNFLGVPGGASGSSVLGNFMNGGGPISIKLPLNPLIEVSGFIPSKCKVMKSKKEPLWLCFQNADPKSGPYLAMFKAGDDLRQDMLVLQLFRIMDRLWRSHGLHLDMAIYGVLATGDQCGFVEVVTKSKTISELQGLSFKDEVLFDFLLESNGGSTNATPQNASQPATTPQAGPGSATIAKPLPNGSQPVVTTIDHPLTLAVSRFTRSCAAYCVATYVLGIGDRHNGNVMIREDGTLFHIDFGHVLGNFKEKYGIRRERVPFVFTPEMVYVMGDKNDLFYAQFVEMCTTAYNLLRSSAALFMNLFAMMMSSGMPELQTVEDLFYLKDTLDLDLTTQQAGEKFSDMLESSSKALSTRVNWVIHNIAQRLK